MSEAQIPRDPVPMDDGQPIEDLLNSLTQLVRTITTSRRGVDDVLADLCTAAGRAIGVDGARVVRTHEDVTPGDRRHRPGVTVLQPPTLADGPHLADRPTMMLRSAGRVLGFLELPATSGPSWTDREQALATLFAELATSCLALAEERDHAAGLTQALEYRVTHDDLTGLPNRGLLLDRLEHALLADVRSARTVAVMFIDIDGFKELNDTFGHTFGDGVLVAAARQLTKALRVGDTVGRLGGDEFLVICENLEGTAAAVNRRLRTVGRRLQRRLGRLRVGEAEVVVSLSIGVAVGARSREPGDLIRSADRAMYAAKERGGGHLAFAGADVVPLTRRGKRPNGTFRPPTPVHRVHGGSRALWPVDPRG